MTLGAVADVDPGGRVDVAAAAAAAAVQPYMSRKRWAQQQPWQLWAEPLIWKQWANNMASP